MSPLDHLRAEIRDAVARANPIDEARRSIELIAETSVRVFERNGDARNHVIDENGERRMKTVDGREVEFTIDDLIAEIRSKHPSLFKRASAQQAASAVAAPSPASLAPNAEEAPRAPLPAAGPSLPPAATLAAPVPRPAEPPPARRDWLELGGAVSAPSGGVAGQSPAAGAASHSAPIAEADLPRAPRVEGASGGPQGRGWFRMIGSAGPVIRIASNGMASRLSGLTASLRSTGDRVPGSLRATGEGLRRVAGPVLRTSAALVLLLIGGSVIYGLGSLAFRSESGDANRTAAVATTREPTTTGSISPTRQQPAPSSAATNAVANDNGPIRGVPEVLDTATLSIHGKVIRLFGIEWVRGAGEPSDLASYIRGREVSCEPAKAGSATYRCTVEGQDLSKVVLYNGGGRATSEATPDLTAAEAHARSARTGLWARGG